MLQEKSFESGRAFRLTAEIWVGGWRGSKHYTVVVRSPNSRSDTFRPAIVATEGISGQPQMTFETEEQAKTWLNDHRSFFGEHFSDWRVGRTKSYYTCYKVPLEDGSECWLSVFQFPSQGSPEWDRLVRLYPNYFRVGPGFFTETLYQNSIRLKLEEGDRFTTNKSDVIMKLNQAGAFFWLGDYTKYEITKITLQDGTLLCCGNYWSLDEDDDHVQWAGSWDESDNITLEDMEGQINIPGAILEFNGKEVAKQKLGFFSEGVLKNATDDQVSTVMEDPSLSNDEKCKKLFNGRDQEYLWETVLDNCSYYHSETPRCENCEVRTIFIKDDFNETKMDLEQSYNYYVKNHDRSAAGWWEDIVGIYKYLEKEEPEKFNKRDFNLGFFSEELSLTESYNVSPEIIKRVVIKYVKENGYTRGDWNGRYPTESPTVHNINALLRQVEDLEPYECTPEELEEFNTWVSHVQPEGAQAEWMRRCIDTWNKQDSLEKEDLRNLVSFVSYKFSNDAYNRRQEQKRQAELQHQQRVESETNTWAGEIGDIISFTVDEAKTFYSAYGVIWNVTGTDGRTYTWYEEKEVQHGDHVTGKVKALNEFRGIKQTRLVHVEISQQNLGFFN